METQTEQSPSPSPATPAPEGEDLRVNPTPAPNPPEPIPQPPGSAATEERAANDMVAEGAPATAEPERPAEPYPEGRIAKETRESTEALAAQKAKA